MTSVRRMTCATALSIALGAPGCGRDDRPPAPPVPPPAPAAAEPEPTTASRPTADPPEAPSRRWQPSGDPRTARFLGLAAPKPVTWIEHPPVIQTRTTEYTVPGRDGHDAAHVAVYTFGPDDGGTVEANIDRWRYRFRPDEDGRFPEPLVTTFEADGMAVTMVELAGDWKRMGAAWYTPDQVVINAIVEAPVGRVFIQFCGDAVTVDTNRDEFEKMIRGLRRERSVP